MFHRIINFILNTIFKHKYKSIRLSNQVKSETIRVDLIIQNLNTDISTGLFMYQIYTDTIYVQPLRSQDAIYEAIRQVTGKRKINVKTTQELSNIAVLGAWVVPDEYNNLT